MKQYIYNREDWPELRFNPGSFQNELTNLHYIRGRLFGKLETLGFDVQSGLILDTVSDEIVTSSAIEGEKLNAVSVRSSVAKRLGIETAGISDAHTNHYTEAVVEMALDATQNYEEPLTDERLFGWHAALFPTGWSGSHRIVAGAYRKGEMQVVSGAIGKEKVHYHAPPAANVPKEMKSFLGWLAAEQSIDPYIKTAISHLRFEAIHPFDDGNGRIGRTIADFLLARAENSTFRYYSLSAQILKERKDYYLELEFATAFDGSIDRWITWFLGCLSRAIEASEEKVEAVKQKALRFEKWRNVNMNERQLSMLNRLLDGFEGKLTTVKWAKLCKCSHDTALRDIDDLMQKGILMRSEKGGRSTSYELPG